MNPSLRQQSPGTPRAAPAGADRLPAEIDWRVCRFSELSAVELARIYRARQEVFVIEQQCAYLDADALDEVSWHVAAWSPEVVLPLAYARVVNPGGKYAEPSLGRVVTTAQARGTGLGRELVRRALEHCELVFPGQAVRISAQERLERFYGEFGFTSVGAAYLEDGIPHVEMLRRPGPVRCAWTPIALGQASATGER